MKVDIRRLAYQAIQAMGNQHCDYVVDEYLEKYVLSDVDARFFRQLVIGVTENRILLDYYINQLATSHVADDVRDVLRLGLYQLKYLNVPDYASVNESLLLAERVGLAGYKKLINAILRTFIRKGKALPLPTDTSKRLSIAYSHPLWMVKDWVERFGYEATEALLRANNEKPRLSIRVNTRKTTVDAYLKELEKMGVVARKSDLVASGIVIEQLGKNPIAALPGYRDGHFIVQDESSQYVVQSAPPNATDLCVDVCASPGGKATHMAEYSSRVYAYEVSRTRVTTLMKNVARLGVGDRVRIDVVDATHGVRELNERADYVLVDAPCSALGTIRRNPDIKYNRIKEDIAKNAKTQRIILKRASQYVKPGGRLVYSTCTLAKEENEDQVAYFLKKHPDFRLVETRTFLPSVDGCDGFFVASMVRREGMNHTLENTCTSVEQM